VLYRFFNGTQRGEKVHVGINGFQRIDGSVQKRFISVAVDKYADGLDAAAARELARALIAAADELDGLSDPEGTIG
jgi:hypothetical protein